MPVDLASLYILHYPDPVLRQRAKEVPEVADEVRSVARRMIQLMNEADGIGLAAPQVGLPWRMFVCHVPPSEQRSPETDPPTATTEPMVCINPVLSAPLGELKPYEEGCLSLPEITGDVHRPEHITVTATGLDGERFSRTGGGLLARCWQHEFDHLEGILIIDRMTQMSRLKNRTAVKRLEKESRL
jgi:peptide deformylase